MERASKAAAVFLEGVFKDQTMINHRSMSRTEWLFNIEQAPWWGGVFESLIKSTKRCLRKFTGQAKFSLDKLHTVIVEVKSIINSRPLTNISPSNLEEVLTPSYLITGKCVINLADDLSYQIHLGDENFTVSREQTRKRIKYNHLILNNFWTRWHKEYLAELRESYHNYGQRCSGAPLITVGNVVMVHNDNLHVCVDFGS